MYKVFKARGYGNVTIENVTTMASVIIGKINPAIIEKLAPTLDENKITASDEWDFEINKETAIALTSMTMKMKKPVRNQSKKNATSEQKTKTEIDAFDLIFG